jgi:predicted type IV restriction endonuclease
MIFAWKVLDIIQEADEITQVKYSVTASNDGNSVSTEGYWTFKDKTHFLQKLTTEKDVIAWIKDESIIDEKCIIEDNLEKQLLAIEPVSLKKPWVLPTFTVKI